MLAQPAMAVPAEDLATHHSPGSSPPNLIAFDAVMPEVAFAATFFTFNVSGAREYKSSRDQPR